MRELTTLVLLTLFLSPAKAAVTLPDTPAAETLAELVEVINSGDAEHAAAYFEKYLPGQPVPEGPLLPFMDSSEGVEVIWVLLSRPLSIDFVIMARADDTRTVGHISIEEADPHRITSIRFNIP